MQSAAAVFLITVGLGQLMAMGWGLYALSLVGTRRRLGWGLGIGLLLGGSLLLPPTISVLGWTPAAGLLAVVALLLGGSWIAPLPSPNRLFEADHPAHGGCRRVDMPDGVHTIPGLLLTPPPTVTAARAAVCVVPGAGDTKIFYKWMLVRHLLAEGLTVLTIDPPGHGDNRQRPLAYPDCLSTMPAVVEFLSAQPAIDRLGIIGISMGGALTLNALAEFGAEAVGALVIVATPVSLKTYNWGVFYRETWRTFFGSPLLPLLREITARQARQTWLSGGYRSRYTTSRLFDLFQPGESLRRLSSLPTLLVYSRRDSIAPPTHAQAMQQAAPYASLIEVKKASHVMITLMPQIDAQIARWLRQNLDRKK